MSGKHPRVDPNNPLAWGQCDRCVKVYQYRQLLREMVTAGDSLNWNGLLVCRKCLDKPHPQDRVRRAVIDPIPIKNPRPEQ